MKTLPTFSKNEFESLKISEITDINNSFAKTLGVKQTKRFSTKPKAIKRAMEHQAQYEEEFAASKPTTKKPTTAKSTTPSRVKLFQDTTVFKIGDTIPKEKTAMGILVAPVVGGSSVSAKKIANHFLNTYVQRNGTTVMDDKFAHDYITGAIRRGHLVISE